MYSLKSYIDSQKPFLWRKRGLLYEPSGRNGYSHASHPCAIQIQDDSFIFAFTQRDDKGRSHIFLSEGIVCDGEINFISEPKIALYPGDECHFDCDGVISVCFVKHNDDIYLYYVGWQNLTEGRWICDTGRVRLEIKTGRLIREFNGPVLGRDKSNPLFAAATAFHVSNDFWQTWYNSGISWEKAGKGWKHYYGIHYAHSNNGVDWVCEPGLCIPFADEYEYAFGRPSVIFREGGYYMWYAHRATKTVANYRIGFSYSDNGRTWTRLDHLSGIDVSSEGWDSEMICYPYVIEHKNQLYMLYNGNSYGKTGFGFATLMKD